MCQLQLLLTFPLGRGCRDVVLCLLFTELKMFCSQECIKPVKIDRIEGNTGAKIKVQDDGSYLQVHEVRQYFSNLKRRNIWKYDDFTTLSVIEQKALSNHKYSLDEIS
jgi:hypothetical protein